MPGRRRNGPSLSPVAQCLMSSARVAERGTVWERASSKVCVSHGLLEGERRVHCRLHGGVDFGAGITARRLSNLVEIESETFLFRRSVGWRESVCARPDSVGPQKNNFVKSAFANQSGGSAFTLLEVAATNTGALAVLQPTQKRPTASRRHTGVYRRRVGSGASKDLLQFIDPQYARRQTLGHFEDL